MVERQAITEKTVLKEQATRLVEESSEIIFGLGYEKLSKSEISTYAKKVYGYLRQYATQRSNEIPRIQPIDVACGILELRHSHDWFKRIMQPFARTLIDARITAQEAVSLIPGLEYTSGDGKYECVHLYKEESLKNAGIRMRNCLRKVADREERLLTDEEGERLHAVYAIQDRRLLRDSREHVFHNIVQIDVQRQIVVDLEAPFNARIQEHTAGSQAMLASLMHLRRTRYPHLAIPPNFLSEWKLKRNELLVLREGMSQPERAPASINPYYQVSEVVSGIVEPQFLSTEARDRMRNLPVLLSMRTAPQELKDSLTTVQGGIEDEPGSVYPNLTNVGYVIVPRIGVTPHMPQLTSSPAVIPIER